MKESGNRKEHTVGSKKVLRVNIVILAGSVRQNLLERPFVNLVTFCRDAADIDTSC